MGMFSVFKATSVVVLLSVCTFLAFMVASIHLLKGYQASYQISSTTNFTVYSMFENLLTSEQASISQNTSTVKDEKELARRLAVAAKHQKIILFWHKPGWYSRPGKLDISNCGNCVITFNKSMIDDPATGAVLFYFNGISPTNMPPTHSRRASDFLGNYVGNYMNNVISMNMSKMDILRMKSKSALSMISNCGSNPGTRSRLKIIGRMREIGYSIEGFGRCFKNLSFKKGAKDFDERMRQYKFFMSFENSYHCRDYITEKVFRNGFAAFTVPVVWGATKEDYAAFLPEGSYIFAEDFKTLESLVQYLQYLETNDTAYLEYFDWHKGKQTTPGLLTNSRFCQVCRAIHGINIDDRHRPDYDPSNPPRPTFTDGIAERHIHSVKSYIFDEENIECVENDVKKWKFYNDWKL